MTCVHNLNKQLNPFKITSEMCLKVVEAFLFYTVVYVLAFDDVFVNGQPSQEMIDLGRTQYQLLREKSTLPHYGSCWKAAVEHVDEGCKNLSEETQSDIALHLANCFLEMSGHETYNCESDKKRNLRAICISNMPDRAFNAYTQFYTHTQNICWFLRGQIWHETISENTFKVGKQLEVSAKNQDELLEAQRESMEVQKKILHHGRLLEEVLEELYISTKAHREVLGVLTKSVGSFQAWIMGEVSWFDSVIYYTASALFILIATSLQRTASVRLPLLLLLLINFMTERMICAVLVTEDTVVDASNLYQNIYSYIWYCRYFFTCVVVCYLIYHFYHFKDIHVENQKFLQTITCQNLQILNILESIKNNFRDPTPKLNLVNENLCRKLNCNGFVKSFDYDCNESTTSSGFSEGRENFGKERKTVSPRPRINENYRTYNLRSKQNTPDLG